MNGIGVEGNEDEIATIDTVASEPVGVRAAPRNIGLVEIERDANEIDFVLRGERESLAEEKTVAVGRMSIPRSDLEQGRNLALGKLRRESGSSRVGQETWWLLHVSLASLGEFGVFPRAWSAAERANQLFDDPGDFIGLLALS